MFNSGKRVIVIISGTIINILLLVFLNIRQPIGGFISGRILAYLSVIMIAVIDKELNAFIIGILSFIIADVIKANTGFGIIVEDIYTVLTGVIIGCVFKGLVKEHGLHEKSEKIKWFIYFRIIAGLASGGFLLAVKSITGQRGLGWYIVDNQIYNSVFVQLMKQGISTLVLGVIIYLIYLMIVDR